MGENRSILKELLAALIGATITFILQFLFLLRPGAEFDWRSLALAAITGGIIGWGYRLATGLRSVVNQALNRLEETTRALDRQQQALDVQQEALQLLLSAKKHKEVIWQMVTASLQGDYKYLSYISETTYLNYLKSAISVSNKSTGVKRRPIRSYKDSNSGVMQSYLHALRDRPMEEKIRIFIIDSEDEEDMNNDLADPDLMNFYWTSAGEDVTSYWITARDFERSFRQITVPKEFAIYDNELLIEYDEPLQTLTFAIVKSTDDRLKVFEKLAEQENNDLASPFTKIAPPQAEGDMARIHGVG
jgi:hypothetical protein